MQHYERIYHTRPERRRTEQGDAGAARRKKGRVSDEQIVRCECRACDGRGWVRSRQPDGGASTVCPTCDGTGLLHEGPPLVSPHTARRPAAAIPLDVLLERPYPEAA